MVFAGKVIVCIVWLFWVLVVDNAVGQGIDKAHATMDHSNMTLDEIEKVRRQVIEKNNTLGPEYFP